MRLADSTVKTTSDTVEALALRVRRYLCQIAGSEIPVTYQALAKALDLSPPNTIHQLTVALEYLIEEDAAAEHPLIAALVVSKARQGLPAPGFFECAQRFGRHDGATSGPESSVFFTEEYNKAVEFWRTTTEVVETNIKA